MDIASRLELFLDVVNQGSYTKAADLRQMDRSSLSKQVTALEKDLGVRLLNRSTRSLSLTEAGKEVFKQAGSVRQAVADTYRIVENFQNEPKGLLRITSPSLFGKLYVHKVIKKFMHNYPDAHVHLTLENRKLNVIEDRYDLAFHIGRVDDSNLVAEKLMDNPLVLLASESFIQQHGNPASPAELIKMPAVFFSDDGLVVNRISIIETPDSKENRLWEFQGQYRVNDPELILDAVRSGMGFGVFAQYMLDQSAEEPALVRLLQGCQLPHELDVIHAVYPHENPPLLVRKFIQLMKEEVGLMKEEVGGPAD